MNESMNRSARARDRCDSFVDERRRFDNLAVFPSIRSRDDVSRARFISFHFISFHFIRFIHSFHSFVRRAKQNETETNRNGVDIDVNGDLITRSFI